MQDRVKDLLQQSTVRVTSSSGWGTGFFVAPGLLVTCAHVVRPATPGSTLAVEWQGTSFNAEVVEIHPDPCPSEDVFPDIALLSITHFDHPCVRLSEDVIDGDVLYGWGFSKPRRYGESLRVLCEGFGYYSRSEDSKLLKLSNSQILPGMSGAPLLNTRTKMVCGMVKNSRGTDGPHGGFAVRSQLLLSLFRSRPLKDIHDRYHRTNHSWLQAAQDFHDWQGPVEQLNLPGFPIRSVNKVNGFLSQYLGSPDRPVPFLGREDKLAELDNWFEDPDYLYGILTAPAGRGKSALLIRWLQMAANHDPPPHVIYFPISVRYGTSHRDALIEALAYQLDAICDRTDRPTTLDSETLLGRFQEALATFRSDVGRLVIVIDGIDEAKGWAPGLWLFPLETPATVKVLLAGRQSHDDQAGSWMRHFSWHSASTKQFSLPLLSAQEVRRIAISVNRPGDLVPMSVDLCDKLYLLSDGDPLLVRLYIDEIRASLSANESKHVDLSTFKPGLAGIFERWFTDQSLLWEPDHPLRRSTSLSLLSICAVAQGPISRDDLRGIAPLVFTSACVILDALHDLERLVVADAGIALAHPRLADYVSWTLLDDADRRYWNDMLRSYCQRVAGALNCAGSRNDMPSAYVVRWYTAYLTGPQLSAADLQPILTEQWYKSCLSLDGSLTGYISDLDFCITKSQSMARIGLSIIWRALLFKSSIRIGSDQIGATLLQLSVENEVTDVDTAYVLAKRLEYPLERVLVLISVAASCREPRRSAILEETYDAIGSLSDEWQRAVALVNILSRLGSEYGRQLLLGLEHILSSISNEWLRCWVVKECARGYVQIPLSWLKDLLVNGARSIQNDFYRRSALISVAPWLSRLELCGLVTESLQEVGELRNEDSRGLDLIGLLYRVGTDAVLVLDSILHYVARLENTWLQKEVLSALACVLITESRPDILDAMESATNLLPAAYKNDVLSILQGRRTLSVLAPSEDVQVSLEIRLAEARIQEGAWVRVRALASIIPELPADLRQGIVSEAIAELDGIRDSVALSMALPQLIGALTVEEKRAALRSALAAAQSGRDEIARVEVQLEISKGLEGQELRQGFLRIINSLRSIADLESYCTCLKKVVVDISVRQVELLETLLSSVLSWRRERDRRNGLEILLSHSQAFLGPRLVHKILEAVQDVPDIAARAELLLLLGKRTLGFGRRYALGQAHALALGCAEQATRYRLLFEIASTSGRPSDAIIETLIREAAPDSSDSTIRLFALLSLTIGQTHERISEMAFARLTEVTVGPARLGLLERVLEVAPSEVSASLLSEVFELSAQVRYPKQRLDMLSRMSRTLPQHSQQIQNELEDVVRALDEGDEYSAFEAWLELLHQCPDDKTLLTKTLKAATSTRWHSARGARFIALVHAVRGSSRSALLRVACEEVRQSDSPLIIEFLRGLVREDMLDSVVKEACFNMIEALPNNASQCEALTLLIGKRVEGWRDNVLPRALKAARAELDSYEKVSRLCGVARALNDNHGEDVFREALGVAATISEPWNRLRSMISVATLTHGEIRETCLVDAFETMTRMNDRRMRNAAVHTISECCRRLSDLSLNEVYILANVLTNASRTVIFSNLSHMMRHVERLDGRACYTSLFDAVGDAADIWP